MSNYKDYGWSNNELTCAHGYLIKPILTLLPKDGSPILDLGCGNGSISNLLISIGYNMYGTDASVSGIEIAKQKNQERFFVQDLSKDELPDFLNSINFKSIISTEVIEHLYDPITFIKFCKTVLLKNGGGNLILSTPYNGYLKNL